MQRLTIIVAIVAALYSAYWFIGAQALERTAQSQVTALRADGWTVAFDDLGVRGFPSRFDTTVTNIAVAAPNGAIGYAAPMLQALALSYQPNKVILAFPETQEITIQDTPFTANATGLRARVNIGANTALSLDSITAEAAEVTLISPTAGAWVFTDFLAALRESGPMPNSYDVYANLENIRVPEALAASFNLIGPLPDTISIAKVDATLTLDRPLNRHTLPDWQSDPGRLRTIDVKSGIVTWGDLSVRASGDLTVSSSGVPDGTLTLIANDWQRMLDIAQSAGLIPAEYQFLARSMGQTLSGGSPDLVLPITFRNGNLSVGPIPLGPAPRFF